MPSQTYFCILKLTILLCTHNRASLLERALAS